MLIHAAIIIDDDRWAKHPYGVEFDDNKCNSEFYTNGVDNREESLREQEPPVTILMIISKYDSTKKAPFFRKRKKGITDCKSQ